MQYIRLCQVWIRLPALVLKPRGDVIRSQWPHKKNLYLPNIFLKNNMYQLNLQSLTLAVNGTLRRRESVGGGAAAVFVPLILQVIFCGHLITSRHLHHTKCFLLGLLWIPSVMKTKRFSFQSKDTQKNVNYTRQLVITPPVVFCCCCCLWGAGMRVEGVMSENKNCFWLIIGGFSWVKVTTHCIHFLFSWQG